MSIKWPRTAFGYWDAEKKQRTTERRNWLAQESASCSTSGKNTWPPQLRPAPLLHTSPPWGHENHLCLCHSPNSLHSAALNFTSTSGWKSFLLSIAHQTTRRSACPMNLCIPSSNYRFFSLSQNNGKLSMTTLSHSCLDAFSSSPVCFENSIQAQHETPSQIYITGLRNIAASFTFVSFSS